MEQKAQPHVLVLTLPFQSFINPCLQLSKRLISLGTHITFMTAAQAINHMNCTIPSPSCDGLSYAPLFNGYDGGFMPSDLNNMSEIKHCGARTLKEFISTNKDKGTPVTHIIYSMLVPWAASVAREFHIPSTLFWIQPAIVFSIYFHFFHSYEDVIHKSISNNPSFGIKLPGLPLLGTHDLPSFFTTNNKFTYVLPTLKEQIEILDMETNPMILVNTFDALEYESIKSFEQYSFVGVGPLLPSALIDGNDLSDTSFGGDLYNDERKESYLKWLDSKSEKSVIYVSFGSIAVLSNQQNEEIAKGLLDSRCSFLWVMKDSQGDEKLSHLEDLEKQGMIVSWCSQVEVLSHPSIGCYLTHCGWNSTIESLALGIPIVVFPQWADQPTNAKLVEDLWETGVKVRKNEELGMVEGCEIKRCLELVMGGGERGEQIRRNAKKWKELGREAAKEGGSSHSNLKSFVGQIGK